MQALLFIVKSVLYDWVAALRELCTVLCKLLHQWCRRVCSGKVPTRDRCVPINDPAFVRPDPLIYDQYYLTGLGLAVTWDNPDIQLYLNGAPVSSALLLPGTTYEIVAQIWNNSTEAPVVGMPVVFSYLDFGVGTVSVPIGSTSIDLGVKGGPGCPAYAKMLWTTPTAAGHYCLQVLLQPYDDSNPQNNLGQENTNIGTAQSAAVFSFTLRNNTSHTQSYKFAVDAYTPVTPDPCGASENDETRRARLARHRRGSQPVPAGWQVDITPAGPSLSPGQSIPITVSATPPASFSGDQRLNVNAYNGSGFSGGVTLTVTAV